MERQIQIPQTIDRTELFGNLDSNLTLIREATGVDIFQRDDGLILKGEDPDTAEGILKVPQTFKTVLCKYFSAMRDQINTTDYESLAMMVLSMNFGFVFLDASFGDKLTELDKHDYIRQSVHVFVNGIKK